VEAIELNKKDIYKGSLLLVNANHPLPSDYQPTMLMNIPHPSDSLIYLEKVAGTELMRLLDDLQLIDEIQLVSGYRTYDEQKEIYETSLKTNGQTFTSQYVALTQCSEHQTGYAIDVGIRQETQDFICPYFPYDGISQTFRTKAEKYGFIERYQQDKERVTGISHEPWHFRYVGYPHAMIINTLGFCLEEYIAFLKDFSQENPYYYRDKKQYIKIFYVPMVEDYLLLTIQSDQVYQISGNNVNGFIVTIWRNVHGN